MGIGQEFPITPGARYGLKTIVDTAGLQNSLDIATCADDLVRKDKLNRSRAGPEVG